MIRRIALISEHASPIASLGSVDSGGQNVYVAQIAKHLARRGVQVDVFTRRDDPCQSEVRQLTSGVRVIHINAGPPRYVPKEELLPHMEQFADSMLQWTAPQRDYDLVHANFWMSGWVGAQYKHVRNVPLVITFHALGRVRLLHQGSADRFPPERIEIERRLMKQADRIIAECPQDRIDQTTLYDADPEKIRVVPCGFDESEFWPIEKRSARREIGFPQDEPLIVQIGRMVPRKGVDNAIRGFARLVRQGVMARMAVVGGESDDPDPAATPEIGRLGEIAREEGVADRVVFTGRRSRERLRYYYSAADMLVTTPWYEPFGITPLEAMACGTPVLGSRVGGIQYSVRDGETGFLVPPNDPDALAAQMARLYREPGLLERMSRQSIDWVKQHFTWHKVTAQLARVYAEVHASRRVHPGGVARALRTTRPALAQEVA
jgi:glycosyltransferase involved in cell wall biosynthesis